MISLKRTLIALVVIAAGMTAASAQNQADVARFEEAAGWDLPLYRGKQIPEYNFRFNGTYYWDHRGYRTGSIRYGGKTYDNVLMNIDAFRQALYVRYQDKIQTWELDRSQIDWFTMGNRKFVNLRKQGIKKAPEGFLQVVYEGKECVYKQVVKSYKESLEISGYSRIGYEDPNYNDKVYVYFEYRENFYFLDKDGKFEKFSSRNYLVKKHPELKKPLRLQIKYNNWGEVPFDIWCNNIMTYIESAK